jgi:hypothetical protein
LCERETHGRVNKFSPAETKAIHDANMALVGQPAGKP